MVTKRKSAKKRTTANTSDKVTTAPMCEAMQISIRMGVLIAFAFFLLTGAWGIREYINSIQKPIEMSFTGMGEHFIPNNTAKITFSFSDLQQSVSHAHDTITTQVQNAYAALTQAGIADKDIQTTSYTIRPEYDHTTPKATSLPTEPPIDNIERSPKLLGYRVSHTATAVVRDTENIGPILTMLTNLNPETVTGPFFSTDEEQKRQGQDTATIKAIRNAKARAHKIAHLSNLRLKKITGIYIYEDTPRPYARLESNALPLTDKQTQQTVPIQQGEQKIRQRAVLTYEVEERKQSK